MDTVILKFGGSSVADNIKLNIVAEKIINLKKEIKNVIVVVSAQGKTTDRLIKEAQELSAIPEEREMDMLLATGEQITTAKLSILLNRKGYPAISLTGWQAGIRTNLVYQRAKITEICPERIEKELEEGKIVVVAGFQGINEAEDITTLGRGGSDSTAVALQASLQAEKCYIFSDVDGIYSADPNMITVAKKLNEISFDEMQEVADAGAKVLHNRCIQMGKKFHCDVVAKSTFSDGTGTKICQEIESSEVKSIVKNDNLVKIMMQNEKAITAMEMMEIYQNLLLENIIVESFQKVDENTLQFRIQKAEQNKVREFLERSYPNYKMLQNSLTKLTIVGYGIIQDNVILNKMISILKKYGIGMQDICLTQFKIEIILDEIGNHVVEELHQELIQ